MIKNFAKKKLHGPIKREQRVSFQKIDIRGVNFHT